MNRTVALAFLDPKDAVFAIEKLKALGINKFDCFGPFGTEELFGAIGPISSRIPLAGLLGGITGGVSGFYLQWWTAVREYPLIVGGRPLNSWPAFIPITFELTILFATFAIIGTYLFSSGYPQLHHPAFEIPDFERASDDTFFVCASYPESRALEFGKSQIFESLNAARISYVTL